MNVRKTKITVMLMLHVLILKVHLNASAKTVIKGTESSVATSMNVLVVRVILMLNVKT